MHIAETPRFLRSGRNDKRCEEFSDKEPLPIRRRIAVEGVVAELVSIPSNGVGVGRETPASDGESDMVQLLREKYVFNNPEAVESFLRIHRRVAPLLIEAAPRFAAAFDNRAPLALEIMPDDETPHSIYALAIWNQDGAEARAALRNFDQGWLAGNLQAIDGRIVFDYELV